MLRFTSGVDGEQFVMITGGEGGVTGFFTGGFRTLTLPAALWGWEEQKKCSGRPANLVEGKASRSGWTMCTAGEVREL